MFSDTIGRVVIRNAGAIVTLATAGGGADRRGWGHVLVWGVVNMLKVHANQSAALMMQIV